MIYFVQAVDGGPVKIGYSNCIERRLSQLESHYKQPLVILATMKGGRKKEAEIHARFSHLRFGRTEQFRPVAELMEFIGRPLLVSVNPDAIEVMPLNKHIRALIFSIRTRAAWRDWLAREAERRGIDAAEVVEEALVWYSLQHRIDPPPPR